MASVRVVGSTYEVVLESSADRQAAKALHLTRQKLKDLSTNREAANVAIAINRWTGNRF